MYIVSREVMREAENLLIDSGITAYTLMESVGEQIANLIRKQKGICTVIAYLGKGNNAGDALVVLRYLREWGYTVYVRPAFSFNEGSDLFQQEWLALFNGDEHNPCLFLDSFMAVEEVVANQEALILDALVGLGSTRRLRGKLLEYVREINNVSRTRGTHVHVWAVDIPSGLREEDECPSLLSCVHADVTLAIGAVKSVCIEDFATEFVGRIEPIPLKGLETYIDGISPKGSLQFILPFFAQVGSLKKRPYEWYKKSAGLVHIWAGSIGMTGAARLCAEACIRSGAGMVTLFVPEEIYPVLASSTLPEVMVKSARLYEMNMQEVPDVCIIGPGLDFVETYLAEKVIQYVQKTKAKVVLDADGINLWSRHSTLDKLPENVVITPHVGELNRLMPNTKELSRKDRALAFSKASKATILFKGARTLITNSHGIVSYNSTGGPAMATAGQGDVLSGVVGALIAQGYRLYDAAVKAAWLCGKSADIRLLEGKDTEETLTASSVIDGLPAAFRALRQH